MFAMIRRIPGAVRLAYKTFRDERNDEQQRAANRYYTQLEGGSLRCYWFRELKWDLVFAFAAFRCELFGHDWVSTDFCSPDSGYMGHACRRCGEEHGTWLY